MATGLDPMNLATEGVWSWNVDELARATLGYIQGYVVLIRTEVIRLKSAITRIVNLKGSV